ncbi:MAG: Uncharacterized protein XD58_0421 [Thermotoga sp. 50_1627]|uniref:hypothetical protein n=1 Tax=Pseudothermotoga sp. TaxID=2033661 RepID=UPI00076DB85A|nr:MAG: Uncharacterized protein XD45_0228 [Thermotoga sp. 50_64]KUK25553.1 MAG: Uncharacterized protein XD58_0421 [Thermotoga sp. 50_1627]MBC7116578.1 hypothetical protein [Pseudothermotoga sp.]MDK2922589.1 hypothetical protein [Pseudothermotoga sp.]HBT40252.1 hypothetical protein [Pseudothermotoga sp.]
MTSFGFATICFSICLIVALLFQLQLGMKKDSILIEPFPKVRLRSPLQNFLSALRQRMNILMELHQLPITNFLMSSQGKAIAVVRLERLADYYSALMKEKEKPIENRLEVEIAGSKKIVRASFEKNGVKIMYSASIVLDEEGQVLTSHSDVAKILIQVLDGESQRVNAVRSRKEYIESLKNLASKYGIEVLTAK